MNDAAREAAAQTAAPVWNPSADAPSPPRFRPKLKSSLPRVLLQDNRSLSINLERKLTNLLKARTRVESRWESNKRKLIVAVRSSRLLDAQRRASWAPAAAAEAAAAEAEMRAAAVRGASASVRSHLASRRQATLSCCRLAGGAGELLADANTGATTSEWRAPKPAGGESDSPNLASAAAARLPVHVDSASVQLPLIYGAPNKAPRVHDNSAPRLTPPLQSQEQQHGQQREQQQHRQQQRQQLEGEQLELTGEEQQPQVRGPHAQAAHRITPPPFRLRRLSLDNSFSSRATLAFSRSLTLAAPAAAALSQQPPAPGRLQYDIHHQIEEEDRLVAFLTFRAKPRVTNAGRQTQGV